IGDGRYEVTGELSVKGNSRPVTVPFSFKEEAGKGVFEGSFPLQRADFGIGEGQWKAFSIVANEIEVSFKFVATPCAASPISLSHSQLGTEHEDNTDCRCICSILCQLGHGGSPNIRGGLHPHLPSLFVQPHGFV